VASGIYWRPGEAGGLLWGMSNPDERPGPAREFDWEYYERMRERVARLLPATAGIGLRRAWAATIDYTPDHLPIIGPLLRDGRPVDGTVVAGAGRTDLIDVSDLGLDRFDAHGRSRLAPDPIALPFPATVTTGAS
jgi:sarcosine oxidase subunit beta